MKASKEPMVKMENIHKWFGEVHALKGVDFEIYPNEVVGLIGGNGAGKSTLINILAGFLSLDRGEIFYKGKKVEISSIEQARKLGIETVYQEQSVIGSLSVAKNVFLGREKKNMLGIMDKKGMREETEKISKELKLEVSSPQQEAQFCSGGERQGIAIARAMHFESEVLVLDEPTRALSVSGVEQVQNFIKKVRDQGVGVVFITHSLEQVYPVADRFVFISRGKKKTTTKKEECSVEELRELFRR